MWALLQEKLKNLQTKISLVLVLVLVPTLIVTTILEYQWAHPILLEEFKQLGVSVGKSIASELEQSKVLGLENPSPVVERILQEALYQHPSVVRMDVVSYRPTVRIVGSTVEEADKTFPPIETLQVEHVMESDTEEEALKIAVPIENSRKRVVGSVHLFVSLRLAGRLLDTVRGVRLASGAISGLLIFFFLSYFLRRTIANDRALRIIQHSNLRLTEQLFEAQRLLMNSEKLAAMGQLTASFAHEIGTPLNAIGGHLSLLQEEKLPSQALGRLEVVQGQVQKIAEIVRNFLQSTAKPASQKQLVDLNLLVEKTLGIVLPRIERLGVKVERKLDRSMGPMRVVPLEVEQILLNLVNNSLDSLESKKVHQNVLKLKLVLESKALQEAGKNWAQFVITDTGEGIRSEDLQKVVKPFFTTKRPGEGTGLGLTISSQLLKKYGGVMDIESQEGEWAKIALRIPYGDKL